MRGKGSRNDPSALKVTLIQEGPSRFSMPSAEELLGVGGASYHEQWYGEREPEFYSYILHDIITYGLPGPILDVGCGVGLFLALASKWGLEVAGCDGSEYAVQQASVRVPNARVKRCFLSEPLPFDTASFGNVLLNQVIEHLPFTASEHALSECHRILRPGGMLFVFSPSAANAREVMADPTHQNALLPSELKALLLRAGFGVTHEPNAIRWGSAPVVGRAIRLIAKGRLLNRLSVSANAYARRL